MATKARISDEAALRRFEEGIDFDPATSRRPADTAEIRAAAIMREYAQNLIDEKVIEARRRGVTWLEIALALDVSPQAVRQKYRDRI
ncbi:hypothetical protein [Nesterenkonia alba]|uniref:hypothetical protein n=1 Tax=Nesterenkonia alba TaxID=515814 RepID=UPI0003B47F47|nr:hypothetical protein [Nesterenkonia alba]